MTTTVLHAIIMIMLLTCAGLQNQVLLSVYIVAVPTTGQEIAPINVTCCLLPCNLKSKI